MLHEPRAEDESCHLVPQSRDSGPGVLSRRGADGAADAGFQERSAQAEARSGRWELLGPPAARGWVDEQTVLTRGDLMSLLKELWTFLRVRKKFWLLPLVAVLVAVGALLVLAQGSAIAPFIYTIF